MFFLFLILFLFLNLYLINGSSKINSLIIGLPINIAGSIYFSQKFLYSEFIENDYAIVLFLIFSFIFVFLSKFTLFPTIDKSLSNFNTLNLLEIEYISYIYIIFSFLALLLNYSNASIYTTYDGIFFDTQSGLATIYAQLLIFPKIAASSGILLFYFNLKNKKSLKLFLLSLLQILPITIITIAFGFRRSELFHLLSPLLIFSVLNYAPNILRKIIKNKLRILFTFTFIFIISGLSIDYTGPLRKYLVNCSRYAECNINTINEYHLIAKEKYRIPGETLNISRIMNQLNNEQINYDFGSSSLNMILFRFAPEIIIGENLRQNVRDNVNGRIKNLLAYTTFSGMGDSILSFGYLAPIKWIYTTLIFIPFFRFLKKHSYFILISLPLVSSIITHMFTHHLDLVAPDLIIIFIIFKFTNLSLNLFDEKIKKF